MPPAESPPKALPVEAKIALHESLKFPLSVISIFSRKRNMQQSVPVI